MSWTCACDTQNLDRARYCEYCGAEHTPAKPDPGERTGSGMAWSPPTPKFQETRTARWTWTPAMQAECDALKAKLAIGATPIGRRVDPELERRYLENLAKRRARR